MSHGSNGTYSRDFVQEFEKFMDELKEFFNAMDLDQLLGMLSDSLDAAGNNPIKDSCNAFLKAKKQAYADPVNCIKALTDLREKLVGLKGDSERTSAFGYSWNADFQLEDYLFVLLGQFLSSSKSLATDEDLARLLQIVLHAISNMQLSDYDKEECLCIKQELSKYIAATSDKTLYYLKVKTAIDRGIRLIRRLSTNIYDECQDTVRVGVDGRCLRWDRRWPLTTGQ